MNDEEAWVHAQKLISKTVRKIKNKKNLDGCDPDWMETFVYMITVKTDRYSELDPSYELRNYDDWSYTPVEILKFIFLNK
jgi:hypothetical protein